MARVAVANTSTYIQGSVDYYAYVSGSNIVVDVYFAMRRTNSYSGSTYSSTATPSIMISGSQTWNYTGSAGITVAGGQQNVWQGIYQASRTYASSAGGTTIYVGWKVENDNSGYLGGSGVAAITLPTANTPPTGLAASNIRPGTNGFTANVSITGWGIGSGDKYKTLHCYTYNATSLVLPRRYQRSYGDNLSGDITVDNNSVDDGGLTIQANTRYTLGMYASNGSVGTSVVRVGNYATLAYAPSLSATPIDDSSVLITYSLQADGGNYAKNVQYSLDNGNTWVTAATINTGSATTGNFAITGLTPDTSYTMKTRVSTAAGETDGADVTFKTFPPYEPHGDFYGSVNDMSKQINDFYGRGGEIVNLIGEIDPSRYQEQIQFAGNITAFDGATFVNALKQYNIEFDTPYSLADASGLWFSAWESSPGEFDWDIYIFSKDFDYSIALIQSWQGITLADLGITANITQEGDDIVMFTPIYSNYSSKEVNKIYGSVHTQGITSISGTIDPDGVGNVTAFDGNTFWEAIKNSTPYLVPDLEKFFGANTRLVIDIQTDEDEESFSAWIEENEYPYRGWIISFFNFPLTLEEMGVTMSSMNNGQDYINLTATTGDVTRSKLIHQSFGHINYN